MKLAVMGEITEIVDSLEGKLTKLVYKLESLQKANYRMENEITQSASLISRQQEEIVALKQQNETLRMANSLLGSDDNKRETKLRINSLIREIDYCIAQLSD
jgi:glycerol kinase